MSFLQINNELPSEKRPFRLSDIQGIWDGIASLFKPIKGSSFSIISGFDLDGRTYSAGAVYYNGILYEYDGSKPITNSTVNTYFAKIAVDERLFANGNNYPFAFKYVCGGSSFESESGYVTQIRVTNFILSIQNSKAYLGQGSVTAAKLANESVTSAKLANGSVASAKLANESVTADKLANGSVTSAKLANGSVASAKLANESVTTSKLANESVTTSKLANGSVTRDKLEGGLAPIIGEASRVEVSASTTYNIEDLIVNGKVKTIVANNTSLITISIDCKVASGAFDSMPSLVYIPIVSTSSSSGVTIGIKTGDTGLGGYIISPSTVGAIALALANYGTTGATYIPVRPPLE